MDAHLVLQAPVSRLVSHAAWLDREQRLVAGLNSAQRRVVAALADLSVSMQPGR